jgi:hypothetical protein
MLHLVMLLLSRRHLSVLGVCWQNSKHAHSKGQQSKEQEDEDRQLELDKGQMPEWLCPPLIRANESLL